MERQLKSALKKVDNAKANSRKVHFSPHKSMENGVESRKRQLANEGAQKKQKLSQTVTVLHNADELIIGTENQLRYIETKLQEASLAYSDQFLSVADIMCNAIVLDNRLNAFVEEISYAECQIERSPDELDISELDNLLLSAQTADSRYNDFMNSLECMLDFVKDDKMEMLTDQLASLERNLRKLVLV